MLTTPASAAPAPPWPAATDDGRGGPVRRWLTRRPLLVDAALGVLLSLLALVSVGTADAVPDRVPVTVGAALAALGCLPVVVRSVAPLAALAVALPASLAAFVLGHGGGNNGLGVLFCLYSVAALRPRRVSAAAAAVSGAAVGTALAVVPPVADPRGVATNVLVVALFWGAGAWSRSRAEYVRGLEERAAAHELARLSRDRALLAEARGAVAREMQDVVGHDLMALTVQLAGARRVLHRDVDAAERALAGAERLARGAARDVHRVLGLLGEPDEVAAARPQPGLVEIVDLVADARQAGLDVTYESPDLDDVEPGAALAVHRVVEEALRNVREHAGPASVVVDVRRVGGAVRVTVTDDGRGAPSWRTGTGTGLGMLSLEQRVESYGGRLHAGPRRGGGFEVRAEVPVWTAPPAGDEDGGAL